MMLIKKIVLAAACVALALGPVAASTESNVRMHVRSYETKDYSDSSDSYDDSSASDDYSGSSYDSADSTDSTDSYSGDSSDYSDSSDSYDSTDSADTPAPFVKTYYKDVCSGAGQSPMSVEGVQGVFCVTGQSCVANIANGACPGPQDGLQYGASCGIVKTGVYGCKPNTAPPATAAPAATTCNGPNQSPMSVEGVEGVFCVTGQACVANISNGACPGPQAGLTQGASCGVVKTGVYGCKPNGSHKKHHKSAEKVNCPGGSPMSVEGANGVFCTYGQACVANIYGSCPGPQPGLPQGAYCGTVRTGVFGCKQSGHHHRHKSAAKAVCSGAGQSPMSVEGVEGVFCVTGQACVADIASGACPGPQDGLQYGASCGVVKTGVYGCKPNTAPPATAAPAAATCNGPNQSPMSVEGVEGVFCVTGQACVANISNGACPGPQSGLEHGASCGVVKTGVYGCKPNSSRKKHHHHH